jgi:hypothetical protein
MYLGRWTYPAAVLGSRYVILVYIVGFETMLICIYRATSNLRVVADRGYAQKWDTKEVFHSVYLGTQGKAVGTS